jgi:hypothetical protein
VRVRVPEAPHAVARHRPGRSDARRRRRRVSGKSPSGDDARRR